MEYKNIDFNRDKVKQYEAVREAMNMHDELEEIFSFCVTERYVAKERFRISSIILLLSQKGENGASPKGQTAREAMRLYSRFVFLALF